MHAVSRRPMPQAPGGFTMIELLMAMALMGILMALGIPAMSSWMLANKAQAANEFYMDGFRTARLQAIAHNTPSRIVLTANQTTGQMDWQVDICFPVAGSPCTAVSGNWSSINAPAPNDRDTVAPFISVLRSADALPSSTVLAPTLVPAAASAVYYTALGWVDTSMGTRVTMLKLDPTPTYVSQLPTSAIAITLAGMPVRCNLEAVAPDSRACP